MKNKTKNDNLDKLVALAKRRGFVFPSSEIYGGFTAIYDYGPYGVELLNNIKREWWRAMVQLRDDIVGLDSAIFMSPKIWEASGHVKGFSDPLVECKKCHGRFRLDSLLEEVGVFADEKMTEEEINKIFKEKLLNIVKRKLIFQVFCEQYSNINLIDLGVGVAGRWINFLTNELLHNKNIRYFGYDIMPEAIDILTKKYLNNNNFSFYQISEDGVLENLPNKVNFIWTHEVLQHVIDDELLYFYFEQLSKNFEGLGLVTENVFTHPGREYIKFRRPSEYENLFKKFEINYKHILTYDKGIKEPHNTWLIWKDIYI